MKKYGLFNKQALKTTGAGVGSDGLPNGIFASLANSMLLLPASKDAGLSVKEVERRATAFAILQSTQGVTTTSEAAFGAVTSDLNAESAFFKKLFSGNDTHLRTVPVVYLNAILATKGVNSSQASIFRWLEKFEKDHQPFNGTGRILYYKGIKFFVGKRV